MNQLYEHLSSENDRLTKLTIEQKEKIKKLEETLQEKENSNEDIQNQTVEQIRALGEKNKQLQEELSSLRSENLILKRQRELLSENQDIKSLIQENDRLKRELELQKSQQQFQAQSLPSYHIFSNSPDIDKLSLQELRDNLESTKNQLDSVNDYIHNVDDVVNKYLIEILPQENQSLSTISTHQKIDMLVEALHSSSGYATEIANLQEQAQNNYQCSEEWQKEAGRIQDELTQSEAFNRSLCSCLDCTQQYLYRLVGSDFSQHSYQREFLEAQFQLVCRRSEKLLAEYQHLKQKLENRFGDASVPDSATLSRIKRLIQSVGERLNFLEPAGTASWAVLERCLEDVFTFADVVVPKTRETIVKKDDEIRRLRRELKRVRPFEASGMMFCVVFMNKQSTKSLCSPPDWTRRRSYSDRSYTPRVAPPS